MTAPKYLSTTALALTALACSTAFAPATAQDTIRAISAFPQTLAFSQSFQGFVDLVNEKGEGVVQITYAGGSDLNDVVLTAVPEPGSVALMLGGFGLLFGFQRHRPGRRAK